MSKRLFYKDVDGNVINVSKIIDIYFLKDEKKYKLNLEDEVFYEIDEAEYKRLLKFLMEEGLMRHEKVSD